MIENWIWHFIYVIINSPIVSNPNRSRVLRQAATTGSAPLFHGTGEILLAITGFTSLKVRLNRPVVDDNGGSNDNNDDNDNDGVDDIDYS